MLTAGTLHGVNEALNYIMRATLPSTVTAKFGGKSVLLVGVRWPHPKRTSSLARLYLPLQPLTYLIAYAHSGPTELPEAPRVHMPMCICACRAH